MTEVQKKTKKKSPLWRKVLSFTAVLLGLLVALVVFLPGLLLPNLGKRLAIEQAAAALGGTVQIEALEGGTFSGIELRGFSATRPGEQTPWLSVDRIALSEGLFGLGLGSGPIRIEVTGPSLFLAEAADAPKKAPSNTPQNSEPSAPTPEQKAPPKEEPSPAQLAAEAIQKLFATLQSLPARQALIEVKGARLSGPKIPSLTADLSAALDTRAGLNFFASAATQGKGAAGQIRAAGALHQIAAAGAPGLFVRLSAEGLDLDQLAGLLPPEQAYRGRVDTAEVLLEVRAPEAALAQGLDLRAELRSDRGFSPPHNSPAATRFGTDPLPLALLAKARFLGRAAEDLRLGLQTEGLELKVGETAEAPGRFAPPAAALKAYTIGAEGLLAALPKFRLEPADATQISRDRLRLNIVAAVDERARWRSLLPEGLEVGLPLSLSGVIELPNTLKLETAPKDLVEALQGTELTALVQSLQQAPLKQPLTDLSLKLAFRENALLLDRFEFAFGGGRVQASPTRIDPSDPRRSQELRLNIAPAIDLQAIDTGENDLRGAFGGALVVRPDGSDWKLDVQLAIDRPALGTQDLGVTPERLTFATEATISEGMDLVRVAKFQLREKALGLDLSSTGLDADLADGAKLSGRLVGRLDARPAAALARHFGGEDWLDGTSPLSFSVEAKGGLAGQTRLTVQAGLPAVTLSSLGEGFGRWPQSQLNLALDLSKESAAIESMSFEAEGFALRGAKAGGAGLPALALDLRVEPSLLDRLAAELLRAQEIEIRGPITAKANLPGFASLRFGEPMPEVSASFEAALFALGVKGQAIERLQFAGRHMAAATTLTGSGAVQGGTFDLKARWPFASGVATEPAATLRWQDLALAIERPAQVATEVARTTRLKASGEATLLAKDPAAPMAVEASFSAKDLQQWLAGANTPAASLPELRGRLFAKATSEGAIEQASLSLQSIDEGATLSVQVPSFVQTGQRMEIKGLSLLAAPSALNFALAGGEQGLSFLDPIRVDFEATADEEGAGEPIDRLRGKGRLTLGRIETRGLQGGPAVIPLEILGGQARLPSETRIPLAGGALVLDRDCQVALKDPLLHRIRGRLQGVALSDGLSPALALAHPIFALGRDGRSKLSGTMDLNFEVDSRTPGTEWWRGVNGKIDFKLSDARVVGSALLGQLGRDAPGAISAGPGALLRLLPQQSLQALPFSGLAEQGFDLKDFAMDLVIENGVIRSLRPVELPIGEFRFTLGGTARLDGEVAFDLQNDVLPRLLAKATKPRTGGNNPLGGLVNALNPLGSVISEALSIGVVGNPLQDNEGLKLNMGLKR